MKTARAVPGERAPCLAVRSPTLQAMGLLVEQGEVLLETRRRERMGERRRERRGERRRERRGERRRERRGERKERREERNRKKRREGERWGGDYLLRNESSGSP